MTDFNLDELDIIMSGNIHGSSFNEFVESIDALRAMVDDDLYLEAVNDPGSRTKQMVDTLTRNTNKTSGSFIQAYGNITDAGGNIIGAVFDVVMGSINLGTKIIRFITDKIGRLPLAISKTAGKIGRIPGDTKAKVRGDIRIHITVNDIEKLYNETLMEKLTTFITLANDLSKGDVWKTMFNFHHIKTQGLIHLSDNDMKRCRKMTEIYNSLKAVRFSPSTINMADDANYDIYFGGARSIKFTDLGGKQHVCSYYEALNTLMGDINAKKDQLLEVQKSMGEKYDRTQMNSAWTHVNAASQQRVVNTLQMISSMISLVGDIVKCVILDINEVNKACDAVLAKRGIN